MNSLQVSNYSLDLSNDLFNKFIQYTDVKETTLEGYRVCLRQFYKWLNDNGIRSPQRSDIKAYKSYLETQNFTSGTKARYLRVVKHFFKWTSSENLYPNVADNIKTAKVRNDNTKKEAFLESDIINILNSIDTTTVTGLRDYAIILLCVTGGLRIIEIQRADIKDIKTLPGGQDVIYIQGKGHDDKDQYIKLIPPVKEAINNYLKAKGNTNTSDPLFTGTSNRAVNERITEPSISRIIKTRLRACGYDSDKLTAHSLRHTSNTLLFKSGADLYKVQQHARHSDPKTTEIYLHAVDREKDTSEQDIYNQIFNNTDTKEELIEAISLLKSLDPNKVKASLDFIKGIEGKAI